jgi:DnaK suppressor protein
MPRTRKNGRSASPQISLLLAERKSLRARLAALERWSALRNGKANTGDNTPSADSLDTVQEAMGKEEELGKRESLIQRLEMLARAEEKVREGTYGLCEACGKPIPPARLRALPEAILCVTCAEAEEERRLRRR